MMEKRGKREKRRGVRKEERGKKESKKTCIPSFLTENVRAINEINHRWIKCQFSNHR
jgi:hypothetical protein